MDGRNREVFDNINIGYWNIETPNVTSKFYSADHNVDRLNKIFDEVLKSDGLYSDIVILSEVDEYLFTQNYNLVQIYDIVEESDETIKSQIKNMWSSSPHIIHHLYKTHPSVRSNYNMIYVPYPLGFCKYVRRGYLVLYRKKDVFVKSISTHPMLTKTGSKNIYDGISNHIALYMSVKCRNVDILVAACNIKPVLNQSTLSDDIVSANTLIEKMKKCLSNKAVFTDHKFVLKSEDYNSERNDVESISKLFKSTYKLCKNISTDIRLKHEFIDTTIKRYNEAVNTLNSSMLNNISSGKDLKLVIIGSLNIDHVRLPPMLDMPDRFFDDGKTGLGKNTVNNSNLFDKGSNIKNLNEIYIPATKNGIIVNTLGTEYTNSNALSYNIKTPNYNTLIDYRSFEGIRNSNPFLKYTIVLFNP